MKAATKRFAGRWKSCCGVSSCCSSAVAQHGDPLAEGHRLDLVVRDVHGGHAEPLVQLGELGPHRDAQLRVEVRERLVHQERLRLAHDRAPHRDALALAARERRRLAVEQLVEPERLRDLLDPPLPLLLRQLAQPQAEGEVLAHRHVRVQRVVLEDHRDVALLRRRLGDVVAADRDVAVGDVLEPGDHPQQRRLAAAGRADEHDELALVDLQVDGVDRLDAVRVDLRDLVERDPAHACSPPAAGRSPRKPAGSARRAPAVSSSQSASISSSVSVARRVRVEHRGEADAVRPLLEHCAHRQLDDVHVGPVQRREMRRVVGHLRRPHAGRVDEARHLDARSRPAAPAGDRCSARCRRSRVGSPVTIELMIAAAYSFDRASSIGSPRRERVPHTRELVEVLFAAADVLADRDAEALELLVVAHEPWHVLGQVLARLGREEAEAAVQRHPHAPLQLRVARRSRASSRG